MQRILDIQDRMTKSESNAIIPDQWVLLSNKYIFTIQKNPVGRRANEYKLLSLTLNGVIERDIENPQGKFPAEFDTYQEVRKGDFIFCLFDVEETPRAVGLSSYDGMITGAYTVMSSHAAFDKHFLYYFYLNLDSDKRLRSLYKGLRNTIPKESFLSYKTLVPPLHEQTAIAAFLDRKTAQIDNAIRIKERQIELLKERRQILIQNAVTKGLDMGVQMKESGVEWIGEVPAHWEVIKLGKLSRVLRGASPRPSGDPKFFGGTAINWITVGEITKDEGMFLEATTEYLTQAGKNFSRFLNSGTLVISNSGATLGVPKILRIDGCINDGILAFIDLNDKKVTKEFCFYFLKTLTDGLRDKMNQGATQPNLNTDIVKQLQAPVPPLKEQHAIVSFIEKAQETFYLTIHSKEKEMEKMKEYKATLIDGVVTGKLRV